MLIYIDRAQNDIKCATEEKKFLEDIQDIVEDYFVKKHKTDFKKVSFNLDYEPFKRIKSLEGSILGTDINCPESLRFMSLILGEISKYTSRSKFEYKDKYRIYIHHNKGYNAYRAELRIEYYKGVGFSDFDHSREKNPEKLYVDLPLCIVYGIMDVPAQYHNSSNPKISRFDITLHRFEKEFK